MEIRVSELNPAIKRKIKNTEHELEKKFYKAWSFINPKGEKILFGRFGKLRDDPTIVSLAVENLYCNGGWELIH